MSFFKRKKHVEENNDKPAGQEVGLADTESNNHGNHPTVPPIDYTTKQESERTLQSVPTQVTVETQAKKWQHTETQLHQIDEQRDQLADELRNQLLAARSLAKYQLRRLNRPNQQQDARPVDEQRVDQLTAQIATINEKLTYWYGTDKMANEIHFDADRPYLLLNNGLIHQPNAQQKKSLQRLQQLFRSAAIAPTQVTIDYDDLLKPIWAMYQQDALALPDTLLLNLFQDLQDRTKETAKKADQLVFAPGFKVVEDEGNRKVYDSSGNLNTVVQYRTNGKLYNVSHFLNKSLLSRDLFDNDGVISATQYYAADNEKKVVRENFYRLDGTLAIVKSYLKNEPYIQILGPANVLMAVFNSDLDLITWWFTNHVLKPDSVVIVSIESVLYQTLLNAQDQGIEVIPLISELDPQSPQLQALAQHQNGIESILVAEPSIKQYLEQRTKIDLDITVIPSFAEEVAMGN